MGKFKSDTMKTKVMEITPELAREMLENNRNRRVRDKWVALLADAMKRGKWILSPDGISFDKNGNLINGQHRLMAVVKSGCTVPMVVTFGCDENAIGVIDQGNGIDRADTAGCNGCGWRENESYTLNTIDRPAIVYPDKVGAINATDYKGIRNQNVLDAVVYDCRGNGDGSLAANLTGDHENRVTDYTNCVRYDKQAIGVYGENGVSSTLAQRDYKDPTDLVVQKKLRKYIVRRLTPLECCRLQGFPDWWCDGVDGSDSAKYKMWGNGMSLPNVLHVMRGIAMEENT